MTEWLFLRDLVDADGTPPVQNALFNCELLL